MNTNAGGLARATRKLATGQAYALPYVPHRTSRQSGQFLHSYPKNMCIPLAHRNTEPAQGIAEKKSMPPDIATAARNMSVMRRSMAGGPDLPNDSWTDSNPAAICIGVMHLVGGALEIVAQCNSSSCFRRRVAAKRGGHRG